ncbi:MAG: phytoene desaturase family protein [Phycisphaerae bacterium]
MTAHSANHHRYDVLVIGGGHNGLTAGAMLAKRGRKVLVLERQERGGGLAVGDEFHPGCRAPGMLHDTTCVSPGVIDGLALEPCGLTLTTGTPAVFIPQRDGEGQNGSDRQTGGSRGLILHHDPDLAAEEIAAHSPRDAERYAEYRAFFGRVGRFVNGLFRRRPPTMSGGAGDLFELISRGVALRRLGRKDMLELLRVGPMCVADWLGEWFESELLRCALAAPAVDGMFAGPWSPGTSANLLRHEAMAGRAVIGGGPALIDALLASATQQGVEVRTSAEVERIRVSGGRVEGVTLAGGESIDAPIVACSCDPKQTFLKLVDPGCLTTKLREDIRSLRMRGTTAKVNLALSGPLRFACRPDYNAEHARIGGTLDEMERAFDAVKYGRMSRSPILDVYVSAVAGPEHTAALRPAMPPDSSATPPDAQDERTVVSIVAHFAPYDLADGWNDERRQQLGDSVVDRLSEYAPDLKSSIVGREILTPVDIERRYGVAGGHIHHGEHALDQMIVRPCPSCARYATPIDGLYLCGSGSHPGGGLTCDPGALAAEAIERVKRMK